MRSLLFFCVSIYRSLIQESISKAVAVKLFVRFTELHERIKIIYIGEYLATGGIFIYRLSSSFFGCVMNINTKEPGIFFAVHKIKKGIAVIIPNHRYRPYLNKCR